jgi:type IV secretory pathway VirB6-like protein
MCLAILSFIRSLVTAMWVYVMSLVMKTLLYGLAPVFIPTLLINRTKHIFEGWVAQLVNATLQPILLFIFFVFFVKLLEGSIDNILHTPVCFSKLPEGWKGTGFDFSFWRFMSYSSGEWKVDTSGYDAVDKKFPISIVSVLTFLAIAEIANRFNQVVISISTQISNASTNLIGDGGPIQSLQTAMGHGLNRLKGR